MVGGFAGGLVLLLGVLWVYSVSRSLELGCCQRGRGPTLVPVSWGSEDCGPEPWGDPRVARGEGRGSLMVDGPTGALWFMKHSSALIPPAGQAQPEFSAYLNVVKS